MGFKTTGKCLGKILCVGFCLKGQLLTLPTSQAVVELAEELGSWGVRTVGCHTWLTFYHLFLALLWRCLGTSGF